MLDHEIFYHINAPTSNSPAPFEYISSDSLVARAGHDTLIVVGRGIVKIVARQNAISGYTGATDTLTMSVSFAPINGPVTDADNNSYNTATIGNQVWLTRNLETTKYRDGSPIPADTDLSVNGWESQNTGVQTTYNNDPANKKKYGCLYNWYAATDKRNIAPQGWHVSGDEEWIALINYFGGRG